MLKRSHITFALWFPFLFIGLVFFFYDRIDGYSQKKMVTECQAWADSEQRPIQFDGCLKYSGAFYAGSGSTRTGGVKMNRGTSRADGSGSLVVVEKGSPQYLGYAGDGHFRLIAEKDTYAIFKNLTVVSR